MNIAIVGLGSMGRRRIRLLKEYINEDNKDGWQLFGVDNDEVRQQEAANELGILTYSNLDDVLELCDAVVISTPPLTHALIIQQVLSAGKHVFTELNLVPDLYEENMSLAKAQNAILFLSSTFLYREEVRYIASKVKSSTPGFYRYHVGQYLPDWHPWESYKSFFVANKKTNACRELFAIELPWLQNTFGAIIDCKVVHKKLSDLDIPYDDTYVVIARHESGTIGTLQIDVVNRKAVRDFEFSNESALITWDGSPQGLRQMDMESKTVEVVDLYSGDATHKEGYANFVVENAYYNELVAFIEAIQSGVNNHYSFKEDLQTLNLIDQIEGA